MTTESTRPQNVSISLEKMNTFFQSVDAIDMGAEYKWSCNDGFLLKKVVRGKEIM